MGAQNRLFLLVVCTRSDPHGPITEVLLPKLSATFSKVGGPSADATWSTIGNPNPVMIRPYVAWRASSATEMFVTCDVEVAQESTVFGENTRQPTWLGSSAYNSLLKDVKRRVEKSE